jgi:protein-S-isoprenylcysteine O-methyltransferase Ste14
MRNIFDLPPVWLLLSLASVWSMGKLLPIQVFGNLGHWLGAGIAILGFGLMALAVWKMWRAHTTVVPHRSPSTLVTSGVFGISRNPIYLGDALVLLGAVFYFDAIAGIVIVPLFMKIITTRFILAEEQRMQDLFGEKYTSWIAGVRRWF